MWEFSTDSELVRELEWIDRFVESEIEPLDCLLGNPHDLEQPGFERLVRPLQRQVKERGLWACHLSPELGGRGLGQVQLALMAEIFGRARFGPTVFGSQAPDSGNAEILARYGTAEQKDRYLGPLLDNEIVSCFSMTEPQGGSDPTQLRTRATRVGEDWVIEGEKWFSTSARYAAFLIVTAVTDPDAPRHARHTLFIVPRDTAGVEIVRDVGFTGEPEPAHAHIRYEGVRVPHSSMLGGQGEAFAVAQARLNGGRLHHAMRTVALAQRSLDMMCERAKSRQTQGSLLADKQMVQEKIADSWISLRQLRLLILETAWLLDSSDDRRLIRKHISAVKATAPPVLQQVATAALQIHGSLGLSNEMPFMDWLAQGIRVGLSDGPTDVHKVVVAREVLRGYEAGDESFPDYYRPTVRERAEEYDRAHGAGPDREGAPR
jgi:acyl-CoA dehydrogenase